MQSNSTVPGKPKPRALTPEEQKLTPEEQAFLLEWFPDKPPPADKLQLILDQARVVGEIVEP